MDLCYVPLKIRDVWFSRQLIWLNTDSKFCLFYGGKQLKSLFSFLNLCLTSIILFITPNKCYEVNKLLSSFYRQRKEYSIVEQKFKSNADSKAFGFW